MRLVSRRTGLTAHVIRAWEKRYSAVTPHRTDTNRRLYSEEDVERLRLLRDATAAGHSIGQIAQLPLDQLQELLARTDPHPARDDSVPPVDPKQFLVRCLEATKEFDGEALEATLDKASVALSQPELIEGLVVPFLHEVGELWSQGKLRAANEHLASAVVRTLLGRLKDSFRPSERSPKLVVTTPPAQLHELGALIVTVTAASAGWRVYYLGPNLPSQEIAAAANENRARAVALSIVYPPDDPHLGAELRQLRRFLSDDVALLAGGRSAHCYSADLQAVGARLIGDTASLRRALEDLRLPETSSTGGR